MKGRRDRELLAGQTGGRAGDHRFGDGCGFARDDGLLGRVVIGDDHALAKGREQVRQLAHITKDGSHGASHRRGTLHQLATSTREAQQGGFIESTRGTQGGKLTEGVAGSDVGAHPQLLEHAQGSDAGNAQGRLRKVGLLQVFFLFGPCLGGEGRGRQHGAHDIGEHVSGAVPYRAGAGEGGGELFAHADLLAALTWKHEGDPGARRTLAAEQARNSFTRGDRVDFLLRFVDVGGHERRAVGGGGREGKIGAGGEGSEVVADVEGRGQGLHLRGGCRRQSDDFDVATGDARRLVGAAIFLKGDVPVAAAEAERRHARTTGMVTAAHPGTQLAVDVKRTLFELGGRIRRRDFDRRRQHLLVQGESGLENSSSAGGGLGVTDLALHGPEGDKLVGRLGRRPPLSVLEGELESTQFGDVAGLGAGAVGFDQLHGVWGVAGDFVGAAQGHGLSGADRGVDALAASI